MSIQLLDKTRKINALLRNNTTNHFVFNDVCDVMSDTLSSNVIVLSKKGKILGFGEAFGPKNKKDRWNGVEVGAVIDEALNERLLSILSTKENVNPVIFGADEKEASKYNIMVLPISIASERLGSFIAYNDEKAYDIDDIILAEYGNAIIGLEMLRSLTEENAEEIRNRQVVKAALSSLSSSEKEALHYILDELDDNEGVLVASKLAESFNLTRSVIVNALRKLESAGVIESRSSGMKGTYIKIKNPLLFEELEG